MPSKLQKESRKYAAMMIYEIERLLLSSKVVGDDCWRRLLARKELQRLQKKAKELSIQLLGDSRTNHLEERGNDTDANLVITWSRNPHAKTPIPGKPSKSGLIVV